MKVQVWGDFFNYTAASGKLTCLVNIRFLCPFICTSSLSIVWTVPCNPLIYLNKNGLISFLNPTLIYVFNLLTQSQFPTLLHLHSLLDTSLHDKLFVPVSPSLAVTLFPISALASSPELFHLPTSITSNSPDQVSSAESCSETAVVLKLWTGQQIHHQKILNLVPNQIMSVFICTFSRMSFAKDVSWHQHAPILVRFSVEPGKLFVFTLPFKYVQIGVLTSPFPSKKRTDLVKICLFTIISTIWKLMQKQHIKKPLCQTLMSQQSSSKDATLHITDSTTQEHNGGLKSLPCYSFFFFLFLKIKAMKFKIQTRQIKQIKYLNFAVVKITENR